MVTMSARSQIWSLFLLSSMKLNDHFIIWHVAEVVLSREPIATSLCIYECITTYLYVLQISFKAGMVHNHILRLQLHTSLNDPRLHIKYGCADAGKPKHLHSLSHKVLSLSVDSLALSSLVAKCNSTIVPSRHVIFIQECERFFVCFLNDFF